MPRAPRSRRPLVRWETSCTRTRRPPNCLRDKRSRPAREGGKPYDPAVSFSKGALTEVSDPSGGVVKSETVLAFDRMQRPILSEKIIGNDAVTMASSYNSAGRTYEKGPGHPPIVGANHGINVIPGKKSAGRKGE
jgi:hypothetical protein